MAIVTVGIDLAKNVFAVHCLDAIGKSVQQLQASAIYRGADDIPDVTYAKLKITTSNERSADMKARMAIGKEMTKEYASLTTATTSTPCQTKSKRNCKACNLSMPNCNASMPRPLYCKPPGM